jgi:hypothetical protein
VGLNPQRRQSRLFGPQIARIIIYEENGCQKVTKSEKLFRVRELVQTLGARGGLARIDRTTPNECLASGFRSGTFVDRKLWTLLWATLQFQSQLLEWSDLRRSFGPILPEHGYSLAEVGVNVAGDERKPLTRTRDAGDKS